MSPTDAARHNLPAELSSFVGRTQEVEALSHLVTPATETPADAPVSAPVPRLVTLAGPGGIGKTRLALRVAAAVQPSFADGVWLVELAPLADPAHVPAAVAAAMGLVVSPERPPQEALAGVLRDQHALLLLDNCEHLLDACAALATALLRACPKLRILATSREPLGVEGETVWRVAPLILPAVDAPVADADAVRLFVERARATAQAFTLSKDNAAAVVEICRRLDGIPLAIELAAARLRVLGPDQLLERLADRFRLLTAGPRAALPRHQTLHATIDWSYDLLDAPERTLFARLSVFRGGFTLEAAEAVCADCDDTETRRRGDAPLRLPASLSPRVGGRGGRGRVGRALAPRG
jgi:non-specific serine/threonine protein kinase